MKDNWNIEYYLFDHGLQQFELKPCSITYVALLSLRPLCVFVTVLLENGAEVMVLMYVCVKFDARPQQIIRTNCKNMLSLLLILYKSQSIIDKIILLA